MGQELNTKQNQVVQELDQNILLLAPAGTGKTNTIACRVAGIIAQNRSGAGEILCLTFTNRACKEMKERIVEIVGRDGLDVTVRTFHSFCYDVIKEEAKTQTDISQDFVIFDEEDTRELIRELIQESRNARALQNCISCVKRERMAGGSADDRQIIENMASNKLEELKKICIDEKYQFNQELYDQFIEHGHKLIRRYDHLLRERGGLDFDDLLINAGSMFEEAAVAQRWAGRYRYIHIDEVQDTSEIEYDMIEKIFSNSQILMCGDYFQTIYEWRGSKPKSVFDAFSHKYHPLNVIFNENYRSTGTLLKASHAYLVNAFGTNDVAMFHNQSVQLHSEEEGEKISLKGTKKMEDEAGWIFDSIRRLDPVRRTRAAVLTRNNQANASISGYIQQLNEALPEEERLEFMLVDDYKFFRRQEIKDLLAYVKLVTNRYDNTSLVRVLKRFTAGIGDKTIERFSSSKVTKLGVRLTDFLDVKTHQLGEPYGLLLKKLDEGNVVIFDVESTGTDTTKDEIIQLAAVRTDHEGKEIERFERFLKPAGKVGLSENVHGFSDAYLLEHGEDSQKVLADFVAFIDGAHIVGHNVQFDLQLLWSQMDRLELKVPKDVSYDDTLDMARRFYPQLNSYKLTDLSDEFQTGTQSDHNAMNDVRATRDILLKMVKEKVQPGREFRMQCYADYLERFSGICATIKDLRERALAVRPHELLEHIVEISDINNIYQKEEGRLENIREFCQLVQHLDDPSLSHRDALHELLRITALSNIELDRLVDNTTRIPIITVHQAKGAEFDVVFVAGLQEGTFPNTFAIRSNQFDEEMRLFYVAMTRAKSKLFLSWSRFNQYHRRKDISRLIQYIPSELIEEV
ncbi:MAG: 3'-5' exonuclease [Bacillota bacterium]|nr:3'-5' exonuclease [Bacillota bacterium]MDW7676746.1 3'-5' exonuclease [Bacillota bacterium]